MPINQTIILIPKFYELPCWNVVSFLIGRLSICLLLGNISGIVRNKFSGLRVTNLRKVTMLSRVLQLQGETSNLKLNTFIDNKDNISVGW